MAEHRLLITGSRDWDDRHTIEVALRMVAETHADVCNLDDLVLVSGACPNGADRICEEVWEEHHGKVERHPADWQRHGKSAGFVRNEEMVDLGAQLCIAFIKNNSRGASMTARLAEQAGIEVMRYLQ